MCGSQRHAHEEHKKPGEDAGNAQGLTQMHGVPFSWSCRWFVSWSDDTAAVVTLAWKVRGDRVDEMYTAHCSRTRRITVILSL